MNNSEAIIKKLMEINYVEFIDQIAYLLRYSKNGAVHVIHNEFEDFVIDEINKKAVSELTNDERLIVMIHWVYDSIGIDRYRETPFSIIENITDAELVQEFNRRCEDPTKDVMIESKAIIGMK